MPTALLEQRTALAVLVVDVVDGNGREVAGEDVLVHPVSGSPFRGVTDRNGRARFGPMPETVVRVAAGGEVTGPVAVAGARRIVVET